MKHYKLMSDPKRTKIVGKSQIYSNDKYLYYGNAKIVALNDHRNVKTVKNNKILCWCHEIEEYSGKDLTYNCCKSTNIMDTDRYDILNLKHIRGASIKLDTELHIIDKAK